MHTQGFREKGEAVEHIALGRIYLTKYIGLYIVPLCRSPYVDVCISINHMPYITKEEKSCDSF